MTKIQQINIASDWHRVTAVFSVRFALQSGQINCEWAPRLPTKREQKLLLSKYRKARDQFLAAYAQRIGGNVACVELQ